MMKKLSLVFVLLYTIFLESAFSKDMKLTDGYGDQGTPERSGLTEPMIRGIENSILATDDHENVDLLGHWVTNKSCYAVDVVGTIAYFGDGNSLEIVDFSDPSVPVKLGQASLPDTMRGLVVEGSYAYVADFRKGLRVINVSNPALPYEVGFYDTKGDAYDVAINGNYAYIADNAYGLRVINISNPASPREIGSYTTTNGYYSLGVAARGNYAYVAYGHSGLHVIDVSNPASPFLVGSCGTTDCRNDVVLGENYAFVTDWWPGVRVIDISNPDSLYEIGFYDTDGEARGLAINGDYIYVADRLDGLRVIDFSNPVTPFEAGFYDTGDAAYNVTVKGYYAYVADEKDGLYVFRFPGIETITYTFDQKGWYMVSLPVMPPDSTVSVLFPSALGGRAFTWNAQIGSYDIVTKMEPQKGYWLAITEAGNADVAGMPLNEYTIHIASPGWYMIGSIFGGSDFMNPDDSPDGQVLSPAFGWDPVSRNYVQSTTLDEKEGYWAAVVGECDLALGESDILPKVFTNVDSTTFYNEFGSTPPPLPVLDWETGVMMEKPTKFTLFQNYPNPFNPETKIEFQLPEDADVSIVVYNLIGQEVKTLVKEKMEAGYREVIWYGKDNRGMEVPSGMYIVQMQAGDLRQILKMMVLR